MTNSHTHHSTKKMFKSYSTIDEPANQTVTLLWSCSLTKPLRDIPSGRRVWRNMSQQAINHMFLYLNTILHFSGSVTLRERLLDHFKTHHGWHQSIGCRQCRGLKPNHVPLQELVKLFSLLAFLSSSLLIRGTPLIASLMLHCQSCKIALRNDQPTVELLGASTLYPTQRGPNCRDQGASALRLCTLC